MYQQQQAAANSHSLGSLLVMNERSYNDQLINHVQRDLLIIIIIHHLLALKIITIFS
jgi:hypothetical protein